MIRHQDYRKATRVGLALVATGLAAASTAWAQFPYDPSNPYPTGDKTIIRYDLDETSGTTANDSADPVEEGANDGTISGSNYSWTAGKFGGALSLTPVFTGSPASSYMTASFNASGSWLPQITMAAWINPDGNYGTDGTWILGASGSGGLAYLRFDAGGGALRVGYLAYTGVGDGWIEAAYGTMADFTNKWTHVAGTFDNGTVKLWVNGVEVARNATYAGNASVRPMNSFIIGGVPWDPGYVPAAYSGRVDDVRLMDYVARPPVILWSLNEGTGTNAVDSANPMQEGANTGTINGTNYSWTAGVAGGGLRFTPEFTGSPSSSYVSASFNASGSWLPQITMSAWINPDGSYGTDGTYMLGAEGSGGFAFLRFNSGGGALSVGCRAYITVVGEDPKDDWIDAAYGTMADFTNKWTHVAGTFDNGTVKLWVNGVAVATNSTYAGNASVRPMNNFIVGGLPWDPSVVSSAYSGWIDEVRLANIVDVNLTAQSPAPTTQYWPDANTVVLWHLNENAGTNTADAATPILDGANNGILAPDDTWTTGWLGSGVNAVSGGTGQVSTSLGSGLFTTQATMDAWIRPTALGAPVSYALGWTCPGPVSDPDPNYSPTNYAYSFLRLNSATEVGIGFQVTDGITNYWAKIENLNVGVNLLDGTWRHLAGTFDNGVVRCYLNGSLVGSTDTGYGAGWTLIQPPTFTAASGSPWDLSNGRYIGDIDEVRLSNVARTSFMTPTVSIARSGGNVVVTYSGVLQSASVVTGPYTDVGSASSPYTTSASGGPMFFRSRAP